MAAERRVGCIVSLCFEKPPFNREVQAGSYGGYAEGRMEAHGVQSPEEVLGPVLRGEAGEKGTHVFPEPQLSLPLSVVLQGEPQSTLRDNSLPRPVRLGILRPRAPQDGKTGPYVPEAEAPVADAPPERACLVPPGRPEVVILAGAPLRERIPKDEGVELMHEQIVEVRELLVERGRQEKSAVARDGREMRVSEAVDRRARCQSEVGLAAGRSWSGQKGEGSVIVVKTGIR